VGDAGSVKVDALLILFERVLSKVPNALLERVILKGSDVLVDRNYQHHKKLKLMMFVMKFHFVMVIIQICYAKVLMISLCVMVMMDLCNAKSNDNLQY